MSDLKVSVSYGATMNTTKDEPESEPPEFERFKSLAGKLVEVPKSELDKQREKS